MSTSAVDEYDVVWRARWPLYGGCPTTGELHQMRLASPDIWACDTCDGWFGAEEVADVIAAGNRGQLRHFGPGRQN